ncbi:MAG: alpha/beta fold hydrolase [Rubrimonas sp.]|uniref:alpha/beta fold hydrolase n=1 Tax=Rubrimonas sp. TaxID=2036015 RepID=UPI002FDDC1F0
MTRRDILKAGAAGALAAGGAVAATGEPAARAEATHPPIGRFVEAAGVQLHYVEAGEGPPVVLIHGASGNLRDFSFDLLDRMARAGFRAIAFDRPGFGYSGRPAGADDPAIQARILIAGARALGALPAIALGHSYGGAVAMAWATQASQTLRGAVVVAGATLPWGGDAGLLYNLGARPVLGGLVRRTVGLLVDEDAPDALVSRIFRPDRAPEGYASHIGVGLALRPETFRANAADLHALNGHLERLAPRYAELDLPLEVLHGTADQTVWADVHAIPLARQAPRARLTLLEGVGHMPHHAAPDAVVAAALRLRGDG